MIKNKIKLIALGLVLMGSLGFVGFVNAAVGDLSWTSATAINLSVPDVDDLTIAAESTASAFVIDAGSITVTVAVGDTFTISSASRNLYIDSNTGVTQTCTSGTAQIVITGVAGAYTISPTPSQCGSSGSGSSSSSSSSSSTTTTVATPVVTTAVAIAGCDTRTTGFSTTTGTSCVGNLATAVVATPVVTPVAIVGCGTRTTGFSTASGVSCVGNLATATVPATPATPAVPGVSSATPATPATPASSGSSYNFGTKTLKNGSRGESVKELQKFLNFKLNLGLVIDGMLGPKTITVIKKWQKDNGLVSDGLIGPKTKAMMNAQVQ